MWKTKWIFGILFSASLYSRSRNVLKNAWLYYFQLFIKLLNDNPRLVRLQLRSGQVFYAYRFMDLFKFYEIFIEEVYQADGDDLKLVVDIGGNKGYFSLYMAGKYPRAEFHCYEPEPGNFTNLTRQLKDNGLKFTAFQEGVSGEDGELKLFVNPTNDGGHSLFGAAESSKYVMVKISGIDSVMRRLPAYATIDLLKLDCEGAERDIILSLTPEHAQRISQIFYEPTYKLYNPVQLNTHLLNLGFSVHKERGLFKAFRKVESQSLIRDAEILEENNSHPRKSDLV